LLINKILLPVNIPILSSSLLQQVAAVAERFQSEVILLHVPSPDSHAAGVPADPAKLANWSLVEEVLREAGEKFGQPVRERLQKLKTRGIVVEGDPARTIVRTASAENVELIMMPSYGYTFDKFLLGSVTAKVVRWKECPVWTGAHTQEHPGSEFSLKNILCAVELGPRSQEAASWAAQLAAQFGARLTLTYVTESASIMAPGGSWANPEYQDDLTDDASNRLTQLRKTLGVDADLLVGTGDVPKVLNHLAEKTKADLLILECYPYSGNLRLHGYSIICALSTPVLSI
jgi:nucleotide-binding universal stress UspA family protein